MKRSLSVVSIVLVLVTLACDSSDPLAECIGYCDTYWGDTDGGGVMVDEGEYYACVETCGGRE